MRHVCVLVLLLAGCSGSGGGSSDGLQPDGSMVVTDAVGAKLVVDVNGCQSIVPAMGGPAEPVLGADGGPVCLRR